MLSQPVRRIVQGRGGVTVYTDGVTIQGKQVIVTGPPSLTGLIQYDPVLPPLRAQLLQRFPQGTSIKVEVQPVEGETRTSKKTAEYPVIFSLGT